MRKFAYLMVGASAALAVALLFEPTGAGATQSPQPVTVTNPAASPVPITGSVNVGNLPTSQTVTGNVGISSTDNTVKIDANHSAVTSGDQTSVVADDANKAIGAGLSFQTAALDTRPYRTVRVTVNCVAGSCTSGDLSVSADGLLLDSRHLSAGGLFSGTFDVPGITVTVRIDNSDLVTDTYSVVVVGRAN